MVSKKTITYTQKSYKNFYKMHPQIIKNKVIDTLNKNITDNENINILKCKRKIKLKTFNLSKI